MAQRRPVLRSASNRPPRSSTSDRPPLPPNDKTTQTKWSNTLSRNWNDICSLCKEGRHAILSCPLNDPVAGIPLGLATPSEPCGCYIKDRTSTEEDGLEVTTTRRFKCGLHRKPPTLLDLDTQALPPPPPYLLEGGFLDDLNTSLVVEVLGHPTEEPVTTTSPEEPSTSTPVQPDPPSTPIPNPGPRISVPDLPPPILPTDPTTNPGEPLHPAATSGEAGDRSPTAGPIRRRRRTTKSEKEVLELYDSIFQAVLGGSSLRAALDASNHFSGRTHWRRIRSLAELCIADRDKFLEIFNPSRNYKELAEDSDKALKEPLISARLAALAVEKKVLPNWQGSKRTA